MAEKITEYFILEFPDEFEAVQSSGVIQDFMMTPQGVGFVAAPERVVIWTYENKLYVSSGALKAVRAAGLVPVPTAKVPAQQLPQARALMLGLKSDWND